MPSPTEPRLSICVLAACPFPANHGTPGSIREMAEAVAERGHAVHIVTYHFGERIAVKGPRLHRIPSLTGESAVIVGPTIRRPLYDVQMVFKALQVIRAHRTDLIHAHGYEAALVAWTCRTLTGLPVLYSGHNTMGDELASYNFIRPKWLAGALARMLDVLVPRLADRCLPHSTNIEGFFRSLGLEARTEPVVNFGIDMDRIAQGDGNAIRRRYELGSAPIIVYSGVLDHFQRLDLLLEATAKVVQCEPRAKLLVVVTVPTHVPQIRRQIEELGLEGHAILTEPQPLDAVRDFLAAADVAVVPRPGAPGFPIKLLNYLAARKPCVLFASSANNGLAHRDNAYLVASDTSAALAQAILDVLGDRELSRRLAANGHRFVRQHHDRRTIARQVCAAYTRTLIAAGKRKPIRFASVGDALRESPTLRNHRPFHEIKPCTAFS